MTPTEPVSENSSEQKDIPADQLASDGDQVVDGLEEEAQNDESR